jgi:hypothetical protein
MKRVLKRLRRWYLKVNGACLQSRPIYLDRILFLCIDTHCLIEWDEPNTPVSIMERMNVKSVDGDSELGIGDMCLVRCRERSRWVEYPGKLLAMGSKKEMKLAIATGRVDTAENVNWTLSVHMHAYDKH